MSDKSPLPAQAPRAIQEETLDKLIELIDGPANRIAERILSSRILLAPTAIVLNLGFRLMARVAGRPARVTRRNP